MLARLKQSLGARLQVIVDGVEVLAFVGGSGLSLLFGKVLASVIFALLAIGVATRFYRRDAREVQVPEPVWATLLCGALGFLGAAAVVEAINLPVRFDHSGFEKSNLLIVVALIFAFYFLARALVRRVLLWRTGN